MTGGLWWACTTGLLTPVAMMACAPVFRHLARRAPTSWSGYRTERAMASTRNWREAQLQCARLWLALGAVFALVTVAGFAAVYATGNRDERTWQAWSLVFALIPAVGMLWSFVRVEKHLRSLDPAA